MRAPLGVALAAAAVLGVVVASAYAAIGQPTVGVLVDPFAAYSSVSLLGWDSGPPDVAFPDRVTHVDERAVSGPSFLSPPSRHIAALLEDALAAGRRSATLSFGNRKSSTFTGAIDRIRAPDLVPFLALYLGMALCLLAAGYVVRFVAVDQPGGRAYVFLSVAGALFLATFWDYHTSCWLSPMFILALGGNVLGIGWLAWAFPRPPRASTATLVAVRAVAATVVATTLWALGAPLLGHDPVGARVALSGGVSASLLGLAVAIGVRFWRGDEEERRMLRAAIVGLVLVPVAIAIGNGLGHSSLSTSRQVQTLIPFGGFFIPLSIGYALIRHNALRSREILTRRLLQVPILMLSVTLTVLLWIALDGADVTGSTMWLALQLTIVGVGVYEGLRRLTERYVFQATRLFRPTVEALSGRFATLEDPLAIVAGIEELAEQCQSVRSARVVRRSELVDDTALAAVEDAPAWVEPDNEGDRFAVPMRCLAEVHGVLLVRPHTAGALLSDDDVALLETVASLGAVAVHQTAVLAELHALQRLEREAVDRDKQSTVGVLAAELAHEIAIPLAFLRSVFRSRRGVGEAARASEPAVIDDETLEDADEQVARLERLSKAFRHLQPGTPDRAPVEVAAVAHKAVRLLGPTVSERGVEPTIDVEDGLTLAADDDALTQVFTNLLRNAAQHAAPGGRIGLLAVRSDTGARIDVWDDGVGVPDAVRPDLFRPFVTTTEAGTGLGLLVCARLLRLLGWQIDYEREGDQSVFRIEVPTSDVLGSGPPPP